MTFSTTRARISLVVILIATAISVALGTTAKNASAATCPPPPTPLHPFVPWNDARSYVLTTGGSFEAGSPGWTLDGGATLVNDNAPNPLDPSSHARSLYLPAGATATSACVTAPHIVGIVRFFVKNAGVGDARLKIEIIVKGKVYDAGTITAGSEWAPSPIIASGAPAYKGAVTYRIRLTALDDGSAFTVDDVYFDPYCSS